jgi:hypothetical protein
MVDVVVDQKPLAKLPYNPDDIPEAVKKRVAAVDALYAQNGTQQQPPPSEPPPQPEPPPAATPAEAPAPQAPTTAAQSSPTATAVPAETPPPPEDENSDSWKLRFVRMQGRHDALQKTVGEQEEIMRQMGKELLASQRTAAPQRQAPPPLPPQDYITDQDVANYGSELINLTQRAAAQVVAPQLQRIEEENARLREQLAREARRGLDQQVELAVPNYREIDRNPRWHDWLVGIDVFSGRVRQQLLNEAIASANAPRVISFFRGFLQEEVATGHSEPAPFSHQAAPPREPAIPLSSLAAPGRARPASGGETSMPSQKPIYTIAEIRAKSKALYEARRRGAYVGREAQFAREEAELYVAQQEGRVKG